VISVIEENILLTFIGRY